MQLGIRALLVLITLSFAAAAQAQSYPAKPIHFILSVGDGYTLLLITAAQAIAPSIYKKLDYDLIKDSAPVTQLTAGLYMLLVHPSVPARSLKELIALARANPGKYTYGSAGNGQGTHLTGALLKKAAQIDLLHVPYKGMASAMTDLLAGETSMIFAGISTGLGHVKAGRLRVLAVTSLKRSDLIPDIPTMDEAGLRGFESTTWQGIVVPAGTPRNLVVRLNEEAVKAVRSPELRARFEAVDADPIGTTPEQFAAYIKSETEKWGKVVREAGIVAE